MLFRHTIMSRIFDLLNHLLLIMLAFICVYPFLYVVFCSFSDPQQLLAHTGFVWAPVGFGTVGYEILLRNSPILFYYRNTILYVTVGTALNMILTVFGAYALSRRNFTPAKYIMMGIVFTMFFSGGMVPLYLLVCNIGLYNSRWAVILPTAISAWNMLVMRTSFAQLPVSLEESAKLDGANDFTVLIRIYLPLSKAVVSVILLYYAVGHWNAWFSAMIYLKDRGKYPLQLFLREILLSLTGSETITTGSGMDGSLADYVIKYASIVVSTLPILCLYPFLQKYFVKGIMIGAIKG